MHNNSNDDEEADGIDDDVWAMECCSIKIIGSLFSARFNAAKRCYLVAARWHEKAPKRHQ